MDGYSSPNSRFSFERKRPSSLNNEHIPKVLQYNEACCKRILYREDCQEKNVLRNLYRKIGRKVLKHVAQLTLQHITYTAAK